MRLRCRSWLWSSVANGHQPDTLFGTVTTRSTTAPSKYHDVEILGKLVTRGDDWQPIGFALLVQNGEFLDAGYARPKPSLPGPAVIRGLLAGLIEHVATWPMTVPVDRYHRPASAAGRPARPRLRP